MIKKVYDESQMAAAPPNMGAKSLVPDDIKGFNWGVVWVPPIWAVVHKVWILLIVWIVLTTLSFTPVLDERLYVKIPFYVLLALWGNQWAWQNKNWKSIADFHRVQRLWGIWGFSGYILLMTLSFALVFIGTFGKVLLEKDLDRIICDANKNHLSSAYKDKIFSSRQDLLASAFDYYTDYYNSPPISEDIQPPQVVEDTLIYGKTTLKFFAKGSCETGLNNCGAAFSNINSKGEEELICRYFVENGGKVIKAK